MNYVFEAAVRYLFRRVTRRARPRSPSSLKKEMQQAIAANCSTLDLTLHGTVTLVSVGDLGGFVG